MSSALATPPPSGKSAPLQSWEESGPGSWLHDACRLPGFQALLEASPVTTLSRALRFLDSQFWWRNWHWGHLPADGMPVYYVKNKQEFPIYTAPKVLSILTAPSKTVLTPHLTILSGLTRSYRISTLSTHPY